MEEISRLRRATPSTAVRIKFTDSEEGILLKIESDSLPLPVLDAVDILLELLQEVNNSRASVHPIDPQLLVRVPQQFLPLLGEPLEQHASPEVATPADLMVGHPVTVIAYGVSEREHPVERLPQRLLFLGVGQHAKEVLHGVDYFVAETCVEHREPFACLVAQDEQLVILLHLVAVVGANKHPHFIGVVLEGGGEGGVSKEGA